MSNIAINPKKTVVSPTFRPKSTAAAFVGLPNIKVKERKEIEPIDLEKLEERVQVSARDSAASMASQSLGVQRNAKPDGTPQLFHDTPPSYEFTEKELEELKEKYDVEDMPREQQDALLKELADKGIISNKDVSDFEWVRICSHEDMDLFEYTSAIRLVGENDTRRDPIAGYLEPVKPNDGNSILDRLKAVIEAQDNINKFLVSRRDALAEQGIDRDVQGSVDANNAFADNKRQLLTLLEQLKR